MLRALNFDRALTVCFAAALWLLLSSCTQTHNYATVSAGHVYQRIVCRASAPEKCTTRARETCGEYVITEPLRQVVDDSRDLTMTVQCRTLLAPPTAIDAGE